jgi:hypothetical protein
MAKEANPKTTAQDVVLPVARTEDGEGVQALRSRPQRLDLAEIRPLQEGKPLGKGEIVQLSPNEKNSMLWNVDVKYTVGEDDSTDAAASRDEGHAGPARVTSESYRQNWERIFGKTGKAPN